MLSSGAHTSTRSSHSRRLLSLNNGAPYYATLKPLVVRDAQRLDRGWNDRTFAARVGAGVVARLAALEADPAIDAILVATHVPIFKEQRAQEGEPSHDHHAAAARRQGNAASVDGAHLRFLP